MFKINLLIFILFFSYLSFSNDSCEGDFSYPSYGEVRKALKPYHLQSFYDYFKYFEKIQEETGVKLHSDPEGFYGKDFKNWNHFLGTNVILKMFKKPTFENR